jgi:hypothetical protein
VSLVNKCVTGDFLQLTFNDVGREGGRGGEGREGQKVLSKPSADSFAVGRRQKVRYEKPGFAAPICYCHKIQLKLYA